MNIREIPQRVFAQKECSSIDGDQPHQIDGKIMTISASQKLGVARPRMAMVAPQVVGGRILANRRVYADWQGYHEPDYDCHDTKLNGYWQSAYYLLLYRKRAHQ